MNNTTELNSKVAGLESRVDLLESELSYIDQLLLKCGFPEGIKTLKRTVEELLSESPVDINEDESEVL
ncbi:MAG TPA: hypothetical protein VMR37_01405 [Rhabdochlamydiaceae bacterium]|jgi:hypothetical protein|nr:hypothetical protein [Rhabdochlamydiaceae bacterium]